MDINRNNYETFFLLYLDGELTAAEQAEVENFLTTHADLQKEFSLLQFTIQRPADTVFEPKELLYRREEKRKIIPIYWSRIAAALLLILAGGWFMLTLLNNHKQSKSINEQSVAAIATSKNHQAVVSPEKANQIKKEKAPGADLLKETIVQTEKKNAYVPVKVNSNNLPGNTGGGKKTTVPNNTNSRDLQQPENTEVQITNETDDGFVVVKNSNTIPELQTGSNRNAEIKTGQLAGTGNAPPLLIAAAAGNHNPVIENEYPADLPDNAISVIALNNQNKGITSFFKKIGKRMPGNETAESTKKLRVSVFQFSY